MNQCILQQNKSKELEFFPHIVEFVSRKINTVQLDSFEIRKNENLQIYYVAEGKVDWLIDNQSFSLYPGDIALIRPGQYFGCEKGYLDIGAFNWIILDAKISNLGNEITFGKWSSLSEPENHWLGRMLSQNNKPIIHGFKIAGDIFQQMQKELFDQDLGYRTRTNHLIDELLISILRQLSSQDTKRRDFSESFLQLEQMLRDDLAYQWTVEEMAASMRLGISAFTEKVKKYTGFPPLNYLINIRISEAIKLLKSTDLSLTDIALDTGFYSSQHFSTTFKKMTGYTPVSSRRNLKTLNPTNKHLHMDCIITIDIGTSAVRIFAFDMNGKIIASMKGFYPTFHLQPDYSEQDPEQIFVTILNVLRNILSEKIHPAKYKVAAICFSAAMHTVLPVDKNGHPLGNAIVWADNRAKKEAAELKNSQLGRRIYKATGTPHHPMSPLVKIAWLRKNDKERFDKTYKFVSIKDYVLQQLTGEYVIDHSLASSTGLLNIHNFEWNEESLNYAGITADKLPLPVPVFYSKLSLHKQYASNLGLSVKTKIIIGASDGCLATLGSGVWGEGKATITIDASGAVRVADKKILKDKDQRFFNYLIAEGYYVSGGPTNNGGNVFEWFTRQFGTFNDSTDLEENVSDFFKEAAKVSPGSDGLIFLPYLLGERAPIWNADARGLYFGINIKHEQKHFIRATIEGILYEIYSIGKTLEEHRKIDSLYVNGTFASDHLWMQIIANMFNKPVYVNDNRQSVGTGAFLLSLTERGVYKSLEEATATIKFAHTYLPDEREHAVYMQYFAIFERLSLKLSDEFYEIALLQQIPGK